MQFILVKSKVALSDEEIIDIKEKFNQTTSVLCEHDTYEWISDDNCVYFIGRNPVLTIYKSMNTFNIDSINNLAFIHGWVKKLDEDFLLNAEDIYNLTDDELDGLYVAGKLDFMGNGEFLTSLFSPELYYAIAEDKFAISNRIFTLSEVLNYKTLNRKHLATHIQYQHKSITYDTIFKDIYQIPFGSKIIISNELKLERNYDLFYDENLENLYFEDSEKYWDECFRKVKSQVNAFVNLGIEEKLKVGISGGMDSRLLFSLYHEHISSTFSWGPAYSPEVIAGRMCAEKLGILHETPSLKSAQSSQNIITLFPQHLFAREFEMCPWDFGVIYHNSVDTITVDGQEFVKTLPYFEKPTEEEILTRVKQEFLARNYAIPDNYFDEMVEENQRNTLDFLNNIHDIQKFPLINRVLNRGRWAARVHETILDHAFNIYPLLTNSFLKHAFNSSIEALKKQELVYEIVKRASPELLDIPLFNKSYPQKFVPPLENKIPGKINYKYEYLVKYFDYLKEFIMNNYDFISDMVKREFIESLSVDELNRQKERYDESLSQVIYTLLQTIILLKTPDLAQLKNSLKLNWEIEVDPASDDYDEECLKAIVEYNKDITRLKMENQKYMVEINDLKKQSFNVNKILFYDKLVSDNGDFGWKDNIVTLTKSENGTTVTPNPGNWFGPTYNSQECFLPSKFRLDVELLEFSSQLRIIMFNKENESFVKQIDFGNDDNTNHVTIIYNGSEIEYIFGNNVIKENYKLGSEIGVHFDLWGSKKLMFEEFIIFEI